MKTSVSLNFPAQYTNDNIPGHHVLSLFAEDRIEGLFLQFLYFQLPKLPEEMTEQRVDRVYVSKSDVPERRLDIILPHLRPLMENFLKDRAFVHKAKA